MRIKKIVWFIRELGFYAFIKEILNRLIVILGSLEYLNDSYDIRSDNRRIFCFPDYRNTNPYQKLFYGFAKDHGYEVSFLKNRSSLIRFLSIDNKDHEVILHIHWVDSFLSVAQSQKAFERECTLLITLLSDFTNNGGKLIYTVHDLYSHDMRFKPHERALINNILSLSDIVLLHSYNQIELLTKEFGLVDLNKLKVIEHGNFNDVYDINTSKKEGREKLGIPNNSKVFLVFGQLRQYKGLSNIIDSFNRIAETDRDAFLLIVGKLNYPCSASHFERTLSSSSQFRVIPNWIADKDVNLYFVVSDVVVFSYEKIFTSGGIYLSCMFSRPSIAPSVGNITDLIKENRTGFLYSYNNVNDLYFAMRRFLSTSEKELSAFGENAKNINDAFSWDKSHRKYLDIISNISFPVC